jgi:Leucine-rich repeat (LRR) protein
VYVNNSAVSDLPPNSFRGLKISNLQISNAGLASVSPDAFRGLEDTLQGLNLADNQLAEVPVETLRTLRLLGSLDLSNNRIQYVPNNAFVTLRLNTVKLSDNNITLADGAFNGLEQSLKNLNLKGCQLKAVPRSLGSLAGLAFLDLAQNAIRNLGSGELSNLASITALNLERNVIQQLEPGVFYGVNDTLSSLSLLNNLLTSYPTEAITSLQELRVSRTNDPLDEVRLVDGRAGERIQGA